MKKRRSNLFLKLIGSIFFLSIYLSADSVLADEFSVNLYPSQGDVPAELVIGSKVIEAIILAKQELNRTGINSGEFEKLSYSFRGENILVAFIPGRRELPSYEVLISKDILKVLSVRKSI